MNRIVAFLLIFIFWGNQVKAQDDSVKVKKVKVLPVPAFGYSPETRTYVGAVSLFTIDLYQDTLTRTSNAKAEFNYTWNKQYILEAEWNYFFEQESWFTHGKMHFSRYPDLYYGIGSGTSFNDEVAYDSDRIIIELNALKKIKNRWFNGLNLKYINYKNVKNSSEELMHYPELVDASTFGIGYTIEKDARNNLLTPTMGSYFYTNVGLGISDQLYQELTVDYRRYFTYKERFVLAAKLLNDFNFGTPPFFEYAYLGGDDFVRGYYFGRYRDLHLTTLQTEFRALLFWRVGVAMFAGLSNTYHDMESFNLNQFKPNYGGGIRFLMDKNENTYLRLDYAIGEGDNSGFYVSFGESF